MVLLIIYITKTFKEKHGGRYLYNFFSILKFSVETLRSDSHKINNQTAAGAHWPAIRPTQRLQLSFPVKTQHGTAAVHLVLGRLRSQIALHYHLVALHGVALTTILRES